MFLIKAILSLLILLNGLGLTRCQEGKTMCDINNRPIMCFQFGSPVCGFLLNCFGDSCGQNFDSGCLACSDPKIESYLPGECSREISNESQTPLVEDQTIQRPEIQEETILAPQTPEETPSFQINFEICPLTTPGTNINGNFILGTSCCGNRNEVCSFEYNPVCAYYSQCIEGLCQITKSNGCEACSDTSIEFYIPGPCQEGLTTSEGESTGETEFIGEEENSEESSLNVTEPQEPIFCDSADLPFFCFQNPVCGYIRDCFEGSCNKRFDNECDACGDPTILFYVLGECSPE